MNIKKIHGLGLKVESIKEVKCQCGAANLSTAYFIEQDEFHITCLNCGRDSTGRSYVATAGALSLVNTLIGRDKDQNCIIDKL